MPKRFPPAAARDALPVPGPENRLKTKTANRTRDNVNYFIFNNMKEQGWPASVRANLLLGPPHRRHVMLLKLTG